jgi:hypothetical protein
VQREVLARHGWFESEFGDMGSLRQLSTPKRDPASRNVVFMLHSPVPPNRANFETLHNAIDAGKLRDSAICGQLSLFFATSREGPSRFFNHCLEASHPILQLLNAA